MITSSLKRILVSGPCWEDKDMNWSVEERIEINNAMETLAKAGKDNPVDWQAAQTVALFCSKLPVAEFSLSGEMIMPSGKTTGLAPDQNMVTIDDGKSETKKFSLNEVEERVGQFKVFRSGREITFYHFWEADTATQGMSEEKLPRFNLEYDPETMEPLNFGIMVEKDIFPTISIIALTVGLLASIYWTPAILLALVTAVLWFFEARLLTWVIAEDYPNETTKTEKREL